MYAMPYMWLCYLDSEQLPVLQVDVFTTYFHIVVISVSLTTLRLL